LPCDKHMDNHWPPLDGPAMRGPSYRRLLRDCVSKSLCKLSSLGLCSIDAASNSKLAVVTAHWQNHFHKPFSRQLLMHENGLWKWLGMRALSVNTWGQSSNMLRWPRARKRLWVAALPHTPYCEVYPLLQGIPPIVRYTLYCEVYPLLQGIPPIARYTPYCKIYMCYCSQNIPPISKHTPYYKVANFDTNYTPYTPSAKRE